MFHSFFRVRPSPFLLAVALLWVPSCASDGVGSDAGGAGGASDQPKASTVTSLVGTYSQVVEASYADSREAAEFLQSTIADFLDAPSADGLELARDAWRASREPYLQTEVFRFYGGPIDDPDTGPEGLLNAWPLDEAFIDYVEGAPDAGIIADTDQELTADTLIGLNAVGGDSNISTGYHAIEFLLWGQDSSEDGPGDRPFTDYVPAESDTAERRAEYLTLAVDLLVSELAELEAAWADDGETYRQSFEAAAGTTSLAKILTGMIILSGFETGGERLQTALFSGDQEDEHSCFSDNTHRDMVQDIRGVLNVYLGSYERTDGAIVKGVGIEAVVRELDGDLAQALEEQIRESLELAEALEPPFDQEIAVENDPGRARVSALISALGRQEKLLEDVFKQLGLDVPSAE